MTGPTTSGRVNCTLVVGHPFHPGVVEDQHLGVRDAAPHHNRLLQTVEGIGLARHQQRRDRNAAQILLGPGQFGLRAFPDLPHQLLQ